MRDLWPTCHNTFQMGRLLVRWILMTITVVIVAIVEKSVGLGLRTDFEEGGRQVFIGVAILALINATLGRILKILTFPITCLTLGLFAVVINAAILLWVASLGIGIEIEGDGAPKYLSAFVGAILISLINGILNQLIPDKKDG